LKRILIIDNTFDPPHGCPEIKALVEKAATDLGDVSVTAVRAPEGKIPANLNEFDGVVLSGSKTGIDETAPWIEAEMAAIKQLYDLKIPTFGICYGEQLIARTMGAATGQAKQYEYGWVEVEVGSSSPIFAGLPKKFYSFEFHKDEVRKLPANFKLTASSKDCPVQAYDVEGAPMWGVQFHPERGVDHGRKSLNRILERGEKVINADKGDELFDVKVGETIFRNFLKFVWNKH
jgi:GMP synthase-like glutamine amidotransferase